VILKVWGGKGLIHKMLFLTASEKSGSASDSEVLSSEH
jgi:hypothetical protein